METKMKTMAPSHTKKRKQTQQGKGKNKPNTKLKIKPLADPDKPTQKTMEFFKQRAKTDSDGGEPEKEKEHDTDEEELLDEAYDADADDQQTYLRFDDDDDEKDFTDHSHDFDPTTTLSLPEVILTSSGADIHKDALEEIFQRIPLHEDILRCAAVSYEWSCTVVANLHRIPRNLPLSYCLSQQYPCPLLLMQYDDEEAAGNINYFSVWDNKSLTGSFVPEISGNWIAGSSEGCLVLTEVIGQKVHLLNPLTRAQKSLPSLSTFEPWFDYKFPRGSREYVADNLAYIRRAILLFKPNARSLDHVCMVIVLASHYPVISYYIPGDEKWVNFGGSPTCVEDAISIGGTFYVVAHTGITVSFDFEKLAVVVHAGHVVEDQKPGKRYLVESTAGGILLVLRTKAADSTTSKFYVFKPEKVDEAQDGILRGRYLDGYNELVEETVDYKWVRMESLGDQVLFVGRNSSKSVIASLYNLKGNCIYFTDDDWDDRHVRVTRARAGDEEYVLFKNKVEKYDMGIYDMEDESIRPFGLADNGKRFRVPPVWVEPYLCVKK